jgi:hypothetical protein
VETIGAILPRAEVESLEGPSHLRLPWRNKTRIIASSGRMAIEHEQISWKDLLSREIMRWLICDSIWQTIHTRGALPAFPQYVLL